MSNTPVVKIPSDVVSGRLENASDIFNIAKINNFNLQQFFLSSRDFIPLNQFRFNLSSYNLFVVSEEVKENGVFSLKDDVLLKNCKSKIILDDRLLRKIRYFPSIIARINDSHMESNEKHYAYIGKIYKYEHTGNSMKFWYASCLECRQQFMNIHPDLFSIAHSEQRNELDYCHWEIKNINLLKALNLEKDYNCEE